MNAIPPQTLEKSKQSRRHEMGLSGEFLVAGELLRRGITASITYGNAKRADIIAMYGNQYITLEVKTTSNDRWVIGSSIPELTEDIWVLVYLPPDEPGNQHELASPQYYILYSNELNSILVPKDKIYRENYLKRNKHPSTHPGVQSIRKNEIQNARDAWRKIKGALNMP